jgi:23S rRNA pseudouridine2605 synthase
VFGRIEPERLAELGQGVTVEGVAYGPVQATLDRQQGNNAWLTMALKEGRNREVRRLCRHFGWPVGRLIRVAYGPFQLGNLGRGEAAEVAAHVLAEQLGGAWAERLRRRARADRRR